MKDDRGKAIAWRSVSCKMICYHVSDEKTVQILSRHFVPSLQSAFCTSLRFVPVCSLQSAVCIFYWPDWYCCFCSSEPQVWTEILELEKNLVRLSWPLWLATMCGLHVEKLPRKSTMIEQRLLYTNWRQTQMRGSPIWLPLMFFRVVTACVERNPLRVP